MTLPRKAVTPSVLAFLVIALVPWAPSFRPDYCEQQPHWAFAEHWRYGTDIVFHSGPLGFLGSPLYHPSTYPILLLAHLFAVALTVYVLREMSRRVFAELGNAWLHVIAVMLPLCLTPVSYYSPLLTLPLVLMLALLLLHFGTPDHWETPAKYLTLAALGLSVLIKSSLGLPLVAGVLCIFVDEVRHRKRVPLSLPVFVVALCVGWVLGRQSLSTIGIYLHFTREFVAGYRDAASLWSVWSSALAVLAGVTVLLAIWALFDSARLKLGRAAAIQLAGVWSLMAYGLFLHGFVRADREHTVHEALALLAVAAVVGPWLFGNRRALRVQKATRVCFAATFGFALVEAIAGHVGFGRLLLTGPRDLAQLVLHGPSGLRARYRVSLEQRQREGAKLAVRGPADMAAASPIDPGILLLTPGFRPRPTIVAYAAWTPDLIELNRKYLENSNGPSTVLFQPHAIDQLYPTLTDSAAFLSLATHFRLRENSILPLIFERRERPARARLTLVRKQTVRLGETVELRSIGDSPVWLSISMHPTVIGKAIAAVFKPLPAALDVMVKGRWIRKRLAPQLASTGMLVSPYLETPADFHDFYLAPGDPVRANRVEQIAIPGNADAPFSARLWLGDAVDITLQTIAFENTNP